MPYLGEVRMFAGTFAPAGWAMCAGQLLPISQNEALYTLLGTTYGGDGTSTFAVPDLRGRAPVHFGQGQGLSNYVLGQKAGAEVITLLVSQIAGHNHPFQAQANKDGTKTTLLNGTNAYPGLTTGTAYAAAADGSMGAQVGSGGLTGGSQPHENVQPFLAVNFIIATAGIYPSQN